MRFPPDGIRVLCGSQIRTLSLLWLFWSMVAATLILALPGPTSSLADSGNAKSETVIACFHEKINRFTGSAHPDRCTIRGFRGKKIVTIPVRGMKWGHWGANPTRAAYGVDQRNGKRVRVIASRPIPCDEGRRWYSRAVVVFLDDGKFFGLDLPICKRIRDRSRSGGVRPVRLVA